MKYPLIMQLVSCLVIAAMLIPLVVAFARGVPKSASLRQLRRAFGFPTNTILNAFTDGTHTDGILTKKADAAHSYRHLLVKVGSDGDHIAVCGESDLPLGICADTPAAAEYPANVHTLGGTKGTRLMVGAGAIDADVDVVTAAGGEVQALPAVAGTYYIVGRTLKSCAGAHKVVEVVPCKAVKVVVIALLGNTNSEISSIALAVEASTNGTAAAAAADLPGLAAEAEKIGDDVRDVRAKFATLVTKIEELGDDVRAIAAAQATPAHIVSLAS